MLLVLHHKTGVRLAFADSIWEPKAVADGEPRWGARFIVDPANRAMVAEIEKTIEEVAAAKWPGTDAKGEPKYKAILAKLWKDGKVCFLKEDYCAKSGEPYAGFEDMYSIGAGQPGDQAGPTIVDLDRTRLTKADGRPYSGCYVVPRLDVWAQDNGYGRRINASIKGIQFLRDGDAFGASAPAQADDFDDLSNQGDEDDGSDLA